MRKCVGFSIEDTAAILGVASSVVNTHLKRGLSALRSLLGDYFEGGEHGG